MDVAKRAEKGSEMLVILGKRGSKTVLSTVKSYGGSKTLRTRAP